MIDTLSIRSAYRGKTLPETTIQILCDEIDRLRGEKQKPPQGKTVEVRVAVGVDAVGNWSASGWVGADDEDVRGIATESVSDGFQVYWLTATLPVPAEIEVVARVNDDKCPTCGRIGDPACKTVGCPD